MDPVKGHLVVPRGTELRLFCRIGGSPLPRVTWLKDHTIVRNKVGKSEVENEFLQIQNASAEDSGTYVCMVENLLGVTTMPIKVVTGGGFSKLFTNRPERAYQNDCLDYYQIPLRIVFLFFRKCSQNSRLDNLYRIFSLKEMSV